ncbi:MAG TPA: cytochrome c [Thermoanaerobaculia bacterium]|jgi:cytochrome c556|nr:cytochrome c [Thermoanaerobaculia bacterium]
MKRFLLVLLIAIPALAADQPSDVVKYRQSVMKAMAAHMTSMSLVVKRQVSDRSQLAAHALALRDLSGDLAKFFPRGTGSDKTKTAAKNEVWQRFPEFEAGFAKLQRESTALSEAAKRRDWKALDAQFERVANACADCHRTFRNKDSD